MGARFTDISDEVLKGMDDVDIHDRQAYNLVKGILKKLKKPKLYKEIFTIIYLKGGHKPALENEVYENCIKDFKIIMNYFLTIRSTYGRHSMPSNYMLLDLILRRNGHDPYYVIPYLKNDECRDKVMSIYQDLKLKFNKHV